MSSNKNRDESTKEKISRSVHGYRYEIAFVVIILLGVFLVSVRESEWQNFFSASTKTFNNITSSFKTIDDSLYNFISSITLSEFLGAVFIFIASGVIFGRIRHRFLKSNHWNGTTCPKCGSEIVRKHRTRFDYIISKRFLPDARRYQCTKNACSWTGLRKRGRQRSRIRES